jgi:hypothetical protein
MTQQQTDTIKLSHDIHFYCQQLEKTELDVEQKKLLKTIDGLAFQIFTRPKIILEPTDGK